MHFFTEPLGTSFVFLIIGLCITFLYQLFVNYVLIIGEMRFFLEVRKYKRTSISKIFFLYKLRCIAAPVWVMFCRSVFQFLWNFTIAGGIIKHYEYAMIPYILAENPKLSRKDAFFFIQNSSAEKLEVAAKFSVLKVYIKKKFHGEMDILIILTVLHLKMNKE